jgi:hypothetical protein
MGLVAFFSAAVPNCTDAIAGFREACQRDEAEDALFSFCHVFATSTTPTIFEVRPTTRHAIVFSAAADAVFASMGLLQETDAYRQLRG